MKIYNRQQEIESSDDSGFILVLAMVMLLLLSSLGIWALRTSTSELQVAGGSQRIETQFNVTEGGVFAECLKIGHILQPFYEINNPDLTDQMLLPLTDADAGSGDFDPGGDTAATLANIQAYKNNPALGPPPVDIWPWENLQADYADNDLDYRYLATFLHSDKAPMGYGTESVVAYKYRIASSAARLPLSIEVGGTKIGL